MLDTIYTGFFGPLPYDHVYLTQQTACNYGQSWPMLVYLPICYFWNRVSNTNSVYWIATLRIGKW